MPARDDDYRGKVRVSFERSDEAHNGLIRGIRMRAPPVVGITTAAERKGAVHVYQPGARLARGLTIVLVQATPPPSLSGLRNCFCLNVVGSPYANPLWRSRSTYPCNTLGATANKKLRR